MTAVKQTGNSENVDRKDFTPSEAVRAWQEIETKQGERTDLKELRGNLRQSKPIEQAAKMTGKSERTDIKLSANIRKVDQSTAAKIFNISGRSESDQRRSVKQVENRLDLSGISGLLKKRENILSFFSP